MTYIFEHIFKTGGTTFNLSYLPGAFSREAAVVVRGFRDSNLEDLERLMALPESERRRIRIIAGHNTGCLRPHYPEAKFITLVRDPIERAISGYLHARYHQDAWEYIGKAIDQNNVSLSEFVREDLFARRYADFVSVHNWQAKTVLGADFSPDLDEDAVTKVIRARYDVVGYTERLELFLLYLHVTAGFPLVLFNNRLVRKERQGFSPTAEDLETMEIYNRADRLVYSCARREFDRRVSDIWNDVTRSLYQEYSAAVRQFQHVPDSVRFPTDALAAKWPRRV